MGFIKKISKGIGKGLGEIVRAPFDVAESAFDAIEGKEKKPKKEATND